MSNPFDFRFPSDWEFKPLEQCMSAIIDYRGKSPQKATHGIPLVTAKIVRNGRIDYESGRLEYISNADYDDWMRRGLPKPGDVVITTEAPLGEVAQLDERKVALAQRLITLRGKPELLDNRFLKYLMLSDFVQEQLQAHATGTTVLGIRQSELRKIILVLPPLPVQRRIAQILGRLDDKIEVNRRINRTLEAMARALYRHWFVDFGPFQDGEFVESELGLIPKGWEVGTLGDIAKNERKTVSPDEIDPTTPYVGLADMPKGSISLDTWGEAKDSTSSKFRMKRGQILFGKLRPYFKKVGVAPIDGVCSTDILVIEPKQPDYWGLVLTQLIQQEFIDYTEAVSSGTRMPRVSWKMMAAYPMVIPDPETAARFNAFVFPWIQTIIHNITENLRLAATRDYLLPRLLSGEVKVK